MMNLSPHSYDISPAILQKLSRPEKEDLLKLLKEKQRRKDRNKLADYKAYPKQREFHNAGAVHRERLLMAANQVGKTYCGAAEVAIHLTGRYPDWWEGKRFAHPVRIWAGSTGYQATRDGAQRLLVGEPKTEEAWGTGLIPGEAIIDTTRATGIPHGLDGVTVKHSSGGTSVLGFKSYDQGREKWQGETLNVLWLDEEAPLDVYTEALTRTNATGGIVFTTFTPLKGYSEVVELFIKECGIP
jgi:phage terminase large subunit-like protein